MSLFFLHGGLQHSEGQIDKPADDGSGVLTKFAAVERIVEHFPVTEDLGNILASVRMS